MATWAGLAAKSRSVHSVQATTEPDPTDGTDGVSLASVAFVVPILRAPAGKTFDGTGTVEAFVWVDALGRWVRAPRADEDLADLAGLGEGALPPLPISSPIGRLALVFKGVGLSGAGSPEIDLVCTNRLGEWI